MMHIFNSLHQSGENFIFSLFAGGFLAHTTAYGSSLCTPSLCQEQLISEPRYDFIARN